MGSSRPPHPRRPLLRGARRQRARGDHDPCRPPRSVLAGGAGALPCRVPGAATGRYHVPQLGQSALGRR
eukprot:scaffold41215_cov57-Phaeocystis_antarctica.AAC.1